MNLKAELLQHLHRIEGLEARPSPVAGGTALFYRDQPVAHFHHDQELDLKLGKQRIRAQGLRHPLGSLHHPGRAAGSAWIEIRYATAEELPRVVELVRLAIAGL